MKREEVHPDNVLMTGYSSLTDIEEKLKAFRIINKTALKKRTLRSRETVYYPGTDEPIIVSGREIHQSHVKELRKEFAPDTYFLTYQEDEGIAVVSDLTNPEGRTFTEEIVSRIRGLYTPDPGVLFFEQTNTFSELLELLKGIYFPKLAIIGYIPPDRLEMERINYGRVRKFDSHLRFAEITHTVLKPQPYFPNVKQIAIDHQNESVSWVRMLSDIAREYTKPYYVDEI